MDCEKNKKSLFPNWVLYLIWTLITIAGIVGLSFRFNIIMQSKLTFEFFLYSGWFIILICPLFDKIKIGNILEFQRTIGTETSMDQNKLIIRDIKIINNMYRTNILLIFSIEIDYFVRESYCKEALNQFFQDKKYNIYNFSSNLIPAQNGRLHDETTITRMHFYLYTKYDLSNELTLIKDTIGNFINEKENISSNKSILTDWILTCEKH